MHMADALITPAVGGAGWATSAALAGYSSSRLRRSCEQTNAPLMGVTAAFVFAAQMINFSIPATGSSGHLGGGLLLAALLGPHAAFLAMASILTVQALFFADGGLLALGCNVFNLGFFPCFIAYPLLFRPLAGAQLSRPRLIAASIVAAVVGLQLGAFAVVMETVLSGISALPFGAFILVMQPIHLAIGVVEGLATAAVLLFVWQARPEVIRAAAGEEQTSGKAPARLLAGFAAAALMIGALLSWFASASPDGLEWAMERTSGQSELQAPEAGPHGLLASLQERLAFLPDYGLPDAEPGTEPGVERVIKSRADTVFDPAGHPATAPSTKGEGQPATAAGEAKEAWPAVDKGTSLAGAVGAALTLLFAGLVGLIIRRFSPAVKNG